MCARAERTNTKPEGSDEIHAFGQSEYPLNWGMNASQANAFLRTCPHESSISGQFDADLASDRDRYLRTLGVLADNYS